MTAQQVFAGLIVLGIVGSSASGGHAESPNLPQYIRT
jgi:hypothetical protein